MKKVLMLASVASMIDKFNMDNIKILRNLGYRVDVAANFDFGSITSQERVDEFKQELIDSGITVHNIQVPRKVFDIKGIINSYRKVKRLSETENYKMVHCHSPIGGVVTRLAFRKTRKKGTKVIYTAHGFHFFKGAPLLNWLIYFPLEWLCSFFTDVLITINKEDSELAQRKMHSKRIEYVPGIGIDTKKLQLAEFDKDEKRKELGISADDIVLLSVGELNTNKNQEVIIRAISKLCNSKIHYFIAGQGEKKLYLSELAKELNVNLYLLGYRTDITELCNMSDIFCFPSLREGLSVSLMEAMASGLPCVVSNIRGNSDLISDKQGGFLVFPTDIDGFADKIYTLVNDNNLCAKMGNINKVNMVRFSSENVEKLMREIYLSV